MKKLFITTGLIITVVSSLIFIRTDNVYAGNREWATVGKVLTGVLGAVVVADVLTDGRSYGYYRSYPYYRDYYYSDPYASSPVIIINGGSYHRPVYRHHRRHHTRDHHWDRRCYYR